MMKRLFTPVLLVIVSLMVLPQTTLAQCDPSVPGLVNFNNSSLLSIAAESLPSVVSNYYFTFGYKFDLNDQFQMQINTLGKYTANVMPQGDINVMTTYNKIIGLGVGYKSLGFATTYLQYTYDDVVTIGYAFDFTLSDIAKYSNGSHEILIKYRLRNGNSVSSYK